MTDYSLYLVTDSTMVPETSNFIRQVEEAVQNGATLIQLREKSLSTLEFLNRARQVHELALKYKIPLIINDRLDIALAIDAEGVHIGQDDMPAALARKLLGPDKIIGLTCSNPKEVEIAVKEGIADYLGLGTVYKTNTKKNVKDPEGTGPIGIRKMLKVLHEHNSTHPQKIKAVAIGGINHSNAAKVLFQCRYENEKLDGVAVVSCIMASKEAGKSTRDLLEVIKTPLPWEINRFGVPSSTLEHKINQLTSAKPLVHHITNNVVKNFSANVTLAIGASPIMSELAEEYDEFASKINNLGLLINLGTPTEQLMDVFKSAILIYNKYNRPIVFDPVAAGASSARLNCCKKILNTGQVTVIKGNVGEIAAIWKLTSTFDEQKSQRDLMRGVDSIAEIDCDTVIEIGKEVSKDLNTIVVITGLLNYVIFKNDVTRIKGGHELMAKVVGTGCSLGSTIAAFLASKADGQSSESFDAFEAVIGAVELYNLCGNLAAKISKSPGTFMTNFIDQLYEHTHKIVS